ncbi:MAG: UDP-N-acetylglucosamine 2-epimerase, partial [Bacteroidales bacterium]|nr:UDP-N-acetylglucosamine 2-epimerase [Bacteroidales bacterium]
ERQSTILNKLNLAKNKYLLATIHRDNNTDIPERLNSIFKGLNSISIEKNIEIILPLHPRTAKLLPFNLDKDLYLIIQNNKRFKLTTPVSFLDMIMLEQNCKMVFTDSGGVQKEAYFFRKPSAILRSETEWIELVSNGASLITDADSSRIVDAYDHFSGLNSDLCNNTVKFPPIFGDGKAAEFICEKILKAGA